MGFTAKNIPVERSLLKKKSLEILFIKPGVNMITKGGKETVPARPGYS
jgi:hypothetical protein